MATKSKIAKIISGIAATISFIFAIFIFLPSFWFWVSFETIAAALVMVGCFGEWWLHHRPSGRKKVEKDSHHAIESKFIGMVAIGVLMELVALGHSIREGVKLENQIVEAKGLAYTNELQVLGLKTNLAELNKATLELAHQYDMSTNALAEAKARLDNAESKLISVSNAAETNSPANFPISEVVGSGAIFIDKKDAALIEKGRGVWLQLYSENSTMPGTINSGGGAMVPGEISGFAPRENDELEVCVVFNSQHVSTSGPVPRVTFNNVKFARLNLNVSPEDNPFRVKSGWVSLNFSWRFRFDADFSFETQTNRHIGGWPGILAKRTKY